MEVVVNENSLLLRNPQRLEIGSLDGLPNSRRPLKKELRADLDTTDRLADYTVVARTVVLRIQLLSISLRVPGVRMTLRNTASKEKNNSLHTESSNKFVKCFFLFWF